MKLREAPVGAQPEAMLPAQVRVTDLARIRRERVLPVPGDVRVTPNQEVAPDTLIAEGERPSGVHVVEVAAALRHPSPSWGGRGTATLLVRPGERVTVDQPLAARRRLLRRREVRSPVAGEVLAIDEHGRILILTGPEPVQVTAGISGRIVNVMPRFGAVVEGNGALYQGIWGSGRESFGVLRVLARRPDEPLEAGCIDVSARGAIIVGGSAITRQGLEAARATQVRGVIVGAMSYGLVPLAQSLPFPVMLTEGFGNIPMATPLFEGMVAADGREVTLDGRYEPRWGRRLPELFVPLSQPGEPLVALGPLREGERVRLVGDPLRGRVGRIVRLSAGRRTTESGLLLTGCEVELEAGGIIFVPYSNLEQLG